MKSTRFKRVLSVFIILALVAGWYLTIFGAGKKVDKMSDQLKYGLDINGGVYVLLEADTDATGTERTKLMEQTKHVLENRVNAMGISESTVSIEGENRIRVEMPGVEDAEDAIEQISDIADGFMEAIGEECVEELLDTEDR